MFTVLFSGQISSRLDQRIYFERKVFALFSWSKDVVMYNHMINFSTFSRQNGTISTLYIL